MSTLPSDPTTDDLLRDAAERAISYLAGLDGRPVAPSADALERLRELNEPFPEEPSSPAATLALLDEVGSPATVASAGSRFEILVPRAREAGAWVHVDGAFGLWAAAAPMTAHLLDGYEAADSWATDAHKWLNVPYDSGLVFVRDASQLVAAMSSTAAYLMKTEKRDGSDYVPEISRRARGVEVWAALRSLGRRGLAAMVERSCRQARDLAHPDWGSQSANRLVPSPRPPPLWPPSSRPPNCDVLRPTPGREPVAWRDAHAPDTTGRSTDRPLGGGCSCAALRPRVRTSTGRRGGRRAPGGLLPRVLPVRRGACVAAARRAAQMFTGWLLGVYGKVSSPSALVFVGDRRLPDAAARAGYTGEAAVLEATALGFDTCWIGGGVRRGVVASVLGLGANEHVYSISALGYARERTTMGERATSGMVRARKRRALDTIAPGAARWPAWARAGVELARIAPSATNRQPWRFAQTDDGVRISLGGAITPGISKAPGLRHRHASLRIGRREAGGSGRWECCRVPTSHAGTRGAATNAFLLETNLSTRRPKGGMLL